ncbi:MAG: asparagine synthase (glutamine-hydrolyzing) [Gemmataceae bacterium]
MCGIAGIVDLAGQTPAPRAALDAMAQAIVHRGPDEDGFLELGGVQFASRRLSIVGLADGRQPIGSEDGQVRVVFNGELYDFPEERKALQAKGHRFRTSTDTELLPHLWEEYGERMFDRLRGQFAFALFDARQRRVVIGRDRFGICPLYYALRRHAGGWRLVFGSEVRSLLASGLVAAEPDRKGIHAVCTFFAVPGPRTCFEGVSLLPPGQYLDFRLGNETSPQDLHPKSYWRIQFPERGQEEDGDEAALTDKFEALLIAAVERRLRADVPVVSYLSGGVDSSLVVALASKALGRPIPTFTIGVRESGFNEEPEARLVAKHVGCDSVVVPFGGPEVMAGYPELIRTAEAPVIDTACAAMVALAKSVHAHGYKVALTGEGSDEWLAGYPWFKIHRVLGLMDVVPRLNLSLRLRRLAAKLAGLTYLPWWEIQRNCKAVAGYNAWHDVYGVMSVSRGLFYSDAMREATADELPWEHLGFDPTEMARWHPLNRALAVGSRVMLAGMLLASKGDRVAMHSSVETRYPFLDEDVVAWLAKLHPRWKLRGLKDKYLLRKVAERWLPKEIAQRKKVMFRAPMDAFHLDEAPPYIDELLSTESLTRTGYFDPTAVAAWRKRVPMMRRGPARTAVEMGLVAVTATQLWHQVFVDGSLADMNGATSTNGQRWSTGHPPMAIGGLREGR